MDPTLPDRILRIARSPGGALPALDLVHNSLVGMINQPNGLSFQEWAEIADAVIAATRPTGGGSDG